MNTGFGSDSSLGEDIKQIIKLGSSQEGVVNKWSRLVD